MAVCFIRVSNENNQRKRERERRGEGREEEKGRGMMKVIIFYKLISEGIFSTFAIFYYWE